MQRKYLGHEELNAYLQENSIWVGVVGDLLPLRRVGVHNKRLVLYYGEDGGRFQLTLKRGRLDLPDQRFKLPQIHLFDDDHERITLYCPKDKSRPVIDDHDDDWDD